MAKVIERLTPEEAAARKTDYRERAGFVSGYANNVALNISPWDIKLRFGVLVGATREALTIENWSEVYMSVEHAKEFAKVLNKKLAEYEETFGPIRDMGRVTGSGETEETQR